VLRAYDRSWLRGDVLAGITVAAYAIPQVMAYAQLAGVPVGAGLWSLIAAACVYAVLGSSRQLSVGPESTTAVLTAATIAPLAGGDAERFAVLAAVLALVVAAYALVAWAFRLGFVADLLSRPVLIGYLAGVAIIMMVGQLSRIFGVEVDGDTIVEQVVSFARAVAEGGVDAASTAIGLGTIAALLVVQRRWPRAPGPLLAVVVSAGLVTAFSLQDNGVAVVGDIPVGLPEFGLGGVTWADVQALLLPALGVLVVGYTDNVLTARAFAARSGGSVDANAELLALAGANAAAGLVRGLPVSSSGSRTAIGQSSGSRSQLYSLVMAVSVVVALVAFRPVLEAFPVAALGGIVVYAALRLIEVAEFRRLRAFRRNEFLLALAAMAGVLVLDILYGVLLAVALSVAELLYRVARPHDGILGIVPGLAGMHDVDDYPEAVQEPGLVVYRYDSPLFFANAQDFRVRALAAVAEAPAEVRPVRWFLLNAEANIEVDSTAVAALEEVRSALAERGVVFAMARVKQDLRVVLDRAGFSQRVGDDLIFPTLPTALAAYRAFAASGEPPDGGGETKLA